MNHQQRHQFIEDSITNNTGVLRQDGGQWFPIDRETLLRDENVHPTYESEARPWGYERNGRTVLYTSEEAERMQAEAIARNDARAGQAAQRVQQMADERVRDAQISWDYAGGYSESDDTSFYQEKTTVRKSSVGYGPGVLAVVVFSGLALLVLVSGFFAVP